MHLRLHFFVRIKTSVSEMKSMAAICVFMFFFPREIRLFPLNRPKNNFYLFVNIWFNIKEETIKNKYEDAGV